MIPTDRIAASLAVLVIETDDGFRHCATAWCVGPGEWITVWSDETPPDESARVIATVSGDIAALDQWEQQGPVAAFSAALSAEPLSVAATAGLQKRQALQAVGYPCVIDHPAFNLAPASLTAERYLPYLCPWRVDGHLALFTADDGFLTGRFYHGMAGAPVVNDEGRVLGMILDGQPAPDHPPLLRFRRLDGEV